MSLFYNKHFLYRTHVIYYEHLGEIEQAIMREKQIKGWLRVKKEKLIADFNPNWEFLNNEV